jgi:hypothetical protein
MFKYKKNILINKILIKFKPNLSMKKQFDRILPLNQKFYSFFMFQDSSKSRKS